MARILNLIQAALKSYGPSSVKRILWEKEYSGDKWKFAENSAADCVYGHLERHAGGGCILDLGCGSGNTANELALGAYQSYLGVDISENCLSKAIQRSRENGRGDKNRFEQGDFLSFEPGQTFEVILFRESMYHVPIGKVTSTLKHYANYLKPGGVFIVRMDTADRSGKIKERPTTMVETIRREFDVVEDSFYSNSGATVIVFRPRAETAI